MAQTRAIGKAYRNLIGWVMKLAGYEGTPSEEMQKMGEKPKEPEEEEPTIQVGETKKEKIEEYLCHGATKIGCGADITKQVYNYSKRVYGKPLCRDCQQVAKENKKKYGKRSN